MQMERDMEEHKLKDKMKRNAELEKHKESQLVNMELVLNKKQEALKEREQELQADAWQNKYDTIQSSIKVAHEKRFKVR